MSRSGVNYLFSELDGYKVIQVQRKAALDEIASLHEDRIINSSVEDLVNYIIVKFETEVPILDTENATVDQREAAVTVSGFMYGLDRGETRSVPGTLVTLEVPFKGDATMFRIQASTFTSAPPIGEIRGQTLVLSASGTELDSTQVQASFDRSLHDVGQYLEWLRRDFSSFNADLPGIARQAIEARRQKLLANRNLVSNLSFKLKERSDAPRTFVVPMQRKKIEPRLPPAAKTAFTPEPSLTNEDYAAILKIIHDMTLVMERSPAAFATMDEEHIRQHYLVQLNGQFEGKATGETFNASGKTDILIRQDGKNIFIAECKFWHGEKAFLETIDQLVSYLSWRDTKTAIIVFNRNRDFTNVLQKIKDATARHPLYKTGPKVDNETQFRYVFGQQTDPNREVTITVMAFDIPQPEGASSGEPRISSL